MCIYYEFRNKLFEYNIIIYYFIDSLNMNKKIKLFDLSEKFLFIYFGQINFISSTKYITCHEGMA